MMILRRRRRRMRFDGVEDQGATRFFAIFGLPGSTSGPMAAANLPLANGEEGREAEEEET